MRLFTVIVAIQIFKVDSASKISVLSNDDHLAEAAFNIGNRCFGLSDRWSELLLIHDHSLHALPAKIYHETRTSNSIISLVSTENDQFAYPKKYSDESNSSVQWQESKPTAVMITTQSPEQLKSILSFMKNDVQRIWRPESYFLIVLETRCNVTESDYMFKVIWDYWILNAVILCLSNNAVLQNQSGVELYTFNPYSADHSPQWETIFHKTIKVSIYPGNFSHSWYIFKHKFTEIGSSKTCGDLFFDKTSNLDGYVIPIGVLNPGFLFDNNSSGPLYSIMDNRILKTIAKTLRFDVAEVFTNWSDGYGMLLKDGSYSGAVGNIYHKRSHLFSIKVDIITYPGIGLTYPHGKYSTCFASRITGARPQWTNLGDAKYIWTGLGLWMIFFTVVLYLQNKSYGIVSAFLDAERLIIGTSILHPATPIKHRIILGSIYLMLLVVDGCIRGRFISTLTLARPYPNLETLDQLKEQDVNMYGPSFYKRDVILYPQSKGRFDKTFSFAKCIAALERGEHQRACLTSCATLPYETINSSIIYGSPIPIWTTSVAFATAKHWPMTDRYSLEVHRLVESGIHDQWYVDVFRQLEVNSWKLKRAEIPPYVRPTKLNDLLPAFMLLFLGLSAASIVFTWEMKSGKDIRRVQH